ncbi:unnamed protein product [Angiostrongylus costaricensis]|uniref:ABC transporter permease n=1 Tax=Angiostrongylus costaricensis TaxID=334426 RepID=A0A0R3PAW8_ANGCS|nr:unnamed protein product [Angiostrongylus costaricensis]
MDIRSVAPRPVDWVGTPYELSSVTLYYTFTGDGMT